MVAIGSKGAKAKKIFQQHGIPPWERYNYPLVFVDDILICIAGLWIRKDFMAMLDQRGFEVVLM
jgi:tRNA(Ile)-lysidine synthase